jgi:hypothetical protein
VPRLLLVMTSLLISLVIVPVEANAQTGVTITVGADSVLLDPTLVRVPVQITCDPMDVRLNQGNAELGQAVSSGGSGIRITRVRRGHS